MGASLIDVNRATVISAVVRTGNGAVSRDQATSAVDRALRPGKQLNLVAAYLDETRDGLTSGSSLAPPGVSALVKELRRLGHQRFVEPVCVTCGKVKPLRYSTLGGRQCTACFTREHAEVCSRCGIQKRVATRVEGRPVCGPCLRIDPSRLVDCSGCGRRRPKAARGNQGPLCQSCYTSPPRICSRCGQLEKVHSLRSGEPVCKRCYRSPERVCSSCGRTTSIEVRATAEHGDLCLRCREIPLEECVRCHRIRRCAHRSTAGPLCQGCYERPKHECAECGRLRPVQANMSGRPTCSSCYDRLRRVPCSSCGTPCRPYEKTRCAKCVLAGRLDELVGVPGSADPALEVLRGQLLSASNPTSLLNWLRRSRAHEVLSSLGGSDQQVSHELLDSVPDSRTREHIRAMLVVAGELERRNQSIVRLERWIDDLLSSLPPEHVAQIRPFAMWKVLRTARRRELVGRFTEGSEKWARGRIRAAVEILAWMSGRGTSLSALTQTDVDEWLSSGPTTRYLTRDFLSWCRSKRLVGQLKVPLRQTRSSSVDLEGDQRWDLVERLLHDERIGIDVRVAGLFALLFGQHLSRIVSLKPSDLELEQGDVLVSFGSEPLRLPPLVDDLALRLLSRRGHAILQDGRWLFPGGTPGQHVGVEQLRSRLKEVGVTLRPVRQTALGELARELPAMILADLLGLHTNTAVEWVRRAQGDWTRYAADVDSVSCDDKEPMTVMKESDG